MSRMSSDGKENTTCYIQHITTKLNRAIGLHDMALQCFIIELFCHIFCLYQIITAFCDLDIAVLIILQLMMIDDQFQVFEVTNHTEAPHALFLFVCFFKEVFVATKKMCGAFFWVKKTYPNIMFSTNLLAGLQFLIQIVAISVDNVL